MTFDEAMAFQAAFCDTNGAPVTAAACRALAAGLDRTTATGRRVHDWTGDYIRDALPLRQVDRVIVKGKTEAVEIFTPCENAKLNELTGEALRAYRERRWDASEALWQQVLALVPGDKIGAIYLERIAAIGESPPVDDWDGSVALDKL